MQKNWKSVIIIGILTLIFSMLITFVTSKINAVKSGKEILSGKTIEINDGNYTAEMDMEDFIPCVLMAQMPIESPIESLKAQAVVIRTYILKKMGDNTEITSKELKLPYISYGKLEEVWFRKYRLENSKEIWGMIGNLTGLGKSRIFKNNMEYLHIIIEKTNMKVLKSDGELILPLYHGISSGVTREGQSILGSEYSYLKSVKCSTDMQRDNFLGMQYITMQQLRDKLAKNDIIIYKDNKELLATGDLDIQDLIELIDVSGKDKSGYVVSVKIADTKIVGEDFAKALNLASTAMEINEYEKGIRVTTRGEGHGFGMSLAYAGQLARDGMQWQKILKTFYDATISDY